MNKCLKFGFLMILIFLDSGFPLSVTEAQLGSVAAGSAVGVATAMGVIGFGRKGMISGTNGTSNGIVTAGGVALGALSGFATYYVMMHMLKKYTPDDVLRNIKDILGSLQVDDFAVQEFKTNEALSVYLSSKFGSIFSEQEPMIYLQKLDERLTQAFAMLQQIKDEVENSELNLNYEELKDQVVFLNYLIKSKQILILLFFIKSEMLVNKDVYSIDDLKKVINGNVFFNELITGAIDRLSTYVKSLSTAKEIVSNLCNTIPQQKKFENIFKQTKDLDGQVDFLTKSICLKKLFIQVLSLQNSIDEKKTLGGLEASCKKLNKYEEEAQSLATQIAMLKECGLLEKYFTSVVNSINKVRNQVYMKEAECIVSSAQEDSLIVYPVNSSHDISTLAAAKHEKAWYLILAREDLTNHLNNLKRAKELLDNVYNAADEVSTDQVQIAASNLLHDKIDSLIKNVEERVHRLVNDGAYDKQCVIYENFLNDQEKKDLRHRLLELQRQHEQTISKYDQKIVDIKNTYEKIQSEERQEFANALQSNKEKYELLLQKELQKCENEKKLALQTLRDEYEDKLKKLEKAQELEKQKLQEKRNEHEKNETLVKKNKYKEDCCSICLDQFKNGDVVGILKCNHFFHKNCIEASLKKAGQRCPLCRACAINIDRTDTVS